MTNDQMDRFFAVWPLAVVSMTAAALLGALIAASLTADELPRDVPPPTYDSSEVEQCREACEVAFLHFRRVVWHDDGANLYCVCDADSRARR